MKSNNRAAPCPNKTVSSEAWIDSLEYSPYGISQNIPAVAIKSAVGIGLAYIYSNEKLIRQLEKNIKTLFFAFEDFTNTRKNEWKLYYDETRTDSINGTTRQIKAQDMMLEELKIHCAFSQASETQHTIHSHNSLLNAQMAFFGDTEHSIQSAGFMKAHLDHPFSICDNTDLNYLLKNKDVFGLPYLFSQLIPNSNLWFTYRTIEYLFDKTDQENKLGKFNMYFWSYAELVKRLEHDLQDVMREKQLQDDILPGKYLSMIKKIFTDRDSATLKQIKIMNRFNQTFDNNDEIESKIQDMRENEFTEIFKLNKNMFNVMKLKVSNNEMAITAFLQVLNTGPVFNSLLLAKYVPSAFSEQKNVIYSWKNIGDQTDNWGRFIDTVRADYETTLYTLGGGAVATVLGVCAFNALGLAALGTVLTAGGYMGLAWKKEAESHKLLKVMILSIGWHTPSLAYITYQILVLTTIVTKLCKAMSYAEQSKLQYEKLHMEKLVELDDLTDLINAKKMELQLLTQSVLHQNRLCYMKDSEDEFYRENMATLQRMSEELKIQLQSHIALSREIQHYKIGESAYNTQNRCLLTTYASLKRNIDELTLCQKFIGTLSVMSILNDVAYTLLHTVEKMDGEWNFLGHQIGMLYSHIGSENKRPIAATYLLSPFDSVFHTVSRCVNEQFVHFFCSTSAHPEYMAEIYINISSVTLAFGYFLTGPSSSLLQIIRFLRTHFDMYYSKDKINRLTKTVKESSDEILHQQEILQKRHEYYLIKNGIQARRDFFQISGMIIDKGLNPDFTPKQTLIIDSTPEKQEEFNRIHRTVNQNLGIGN